jgi:glutathione S-transferase
LPLKLYDYVLSADCYTVRLMLALLGLSYETLAVDVHPGNKRTPYGPPPPVFVDGENVLSDVGLILTYLARGYDPKASWMPAPLGAEIARWLAFAATELRPLSHAREVALFGLAEDSVALNRSGKTALRRIDDHLLEQSLSGRDWMADDRPTIADIAVFASVMLSHDSGIGHEDYPAINLWQRRLRRLPGFVGMPGIPDYF